MLAIGLILFACFLFWGFRIPARIAYRQFPQVPFSLSNFLVGHQLELRRKKLTVLYTLWGKKYGDMCVCFFGKQPVIVVNGLEQIKQICVKNYIKFRDHPLDKTMKAHSNEKRANSLRSSILFSTGPYHDGLRAAIQPVFHSSALSSYAKDFVESADIMADELSTFATCGNEINILRAARPTFLASIGQAAFGINLRDEKAKDLHNAIFGLAEMPIPSTADVRNLMVRVLPDFLGPFLFKIFFSNKGGKKGREFDGYRIKIMSTANVMMKNAAEAARKRGDPLQLVETDWRWWDEEQEKKSPFRNVVPKEGSFIDLLMKAKNKEAKRGMADFEIAINCSTLIMVGYDALHHTLANIIYALAVNPRAEAKMLAEIDTFGSVDKVPAYEDLVNFPYVDAVISETLRLYPANFITTRLAEEDVEIDGKVVPKGSWIHVNVWGVLHDERYWVNPMQFRPERFLPGPELNARDPAAFMSFGWGPRMCVGKKFVYEELAIILIRLYQRYTFKLAPGRDQVPMKIREKVILSPEGGIWVTVHPRARKEL